MSVPNAQLALIKIMSNEQLVERYEDVQETHESCMNATSWQSNREGRELEPLLRALEAEVIRRANQGEQP